MPTIDQIVSSGAPPIVAILRGLTPTEATSIGAALVDAGVRIIEVPLNSPDAFTSIAALQSNFGNAALVGAGTVLTLDDVDRLADTGAGLMVTPNTNPEVISRGIARGLEVMPGFLTPSEAFAALAAGARRLKLFPASAQGTRYVGDIRAVLPKETEIWAVGGVDATNARDWLAAGCAGIALGSSIFRPGAAPRDVASKAAAAFARLQGSP